MAIVFKRGLLFFLSIMLIFFSGCFSSEDEDTSYTMKFKADGVQKDYWTGISYNKDSAAYSNSYTLNDDSNGNSVTIRIPFTVTK